MAPGIPEVMRLENGSLLRCTGRIDQRDHGPLDVFRQGRPGRKNSVQIRVLEGMFSGLYYPAHYPASIPYFRNTFIRRWLLIGPARFRILWGDPSGFESRSSHPAFFSRRSIPFSF